MKECKRCGRCCVGAFFDLHLDKDPKEMERWLTYHRCDVLTLGDKKVLKIPISCQNLVVANGRYACSIYDQRPEICKQHWCEEAKELGEALLNIKKMMK